MDVLYISNNICCTNWSRWLPATKGLSNGWIAIRDCLSQAYLSSLYMKSEVVYMSLIMRKTAFCICEDKAADQLRGNRQADQGLCFCYIASTIPLLPKYIISSLCACTARFVSDQIRNPEDRFSHNEAHIQYNSTTQLCSNEYTITRPFWPFTRGSHNVAFWQWDSCFITLIFIVMC